MEINWKSRLLQIVLIAISIVASWYLFIYEKNYPHVKELQLTAGQKNTLDDLGGKNWAFFCYGVEPGNTSGTRVTLPARVFAKFRKLDYDDAYYPYEASYSTSAFLFVEPDGKSKVFWIDYEKTETIRGSNFPEGWHLRGELEFELAVKDSGKVMIAGRWFGKNGENNRDN